MTTPPSRFRSKHKAAARPPSCTAGRSERGTEGHIPPPLLTKPPFGVEGPGASGAQLDDGSRPRIASRRAAGGFHRSSPHRARLTRVRRRGPADWPWPTGSRPGRRLPAGGRRGWRRGGRGCWFARPPSVLDERTARRFVQARGLLPRQRATCSPSGSRRAHVAERPCAAADLRLRGGIARRCAPPARQHWNRAGQFRTGRGGGTSGGTKLSEKSEDPRDVQRA